jgi:hypothetical protein
MSKSISTTLCGVIFLWTFIAAGLQGAPAPQRRRVSPPASVGRANPLDSLGILQPESIRSILLLYLARSMTKDKAAQLESDVQKKPEDIDSRLSLIGYYSWNGRTVVDQVRLRTHVLWFIEHHPEHPATAEPSLRDLPDDPDGNLQIQALWRKNIELRGNETDVLKNAEKFFFSRDPEEADRIIHLLSEKEPLSHQWPDELAKLYNMFGIPGYFTEDASERTREAYRRVLELTHDQRAREALAGDMAEAAFRSGNLSGSVQLAKIFLQSSDRSAMQRANTLLGRVALRSKDVDGAKQYLLDSSKPAASRYIEVAGPMMVLAKELLDNGERDVVVQYLENCLSLWPHGEDVLHLWISDIKNGRKPGFGNLGQ